jgi:serine/threonine-protein kinase
MVIERGARIGDYEVLDELGRGGMGRVYRVRNVISERTEAMKVLLPGILANEDLAARFLREIKVLASLDHPNIAALRTALTVDSQVAMVMELVEGESLSKRLLRGPLPLPEAVAIAGQVLEALAYAHRMGVIHRDIKPANMMVTDEGVVKLTDFGIARSQTDQALTATGTTAGSLSYMSPEQVNGGPIDHRSDLYSAGISLYEMVTGRPPFKGSSEFVLMAAHVTEPPTPPIELRADLPPALDAVILRAIAKHPADRFASADEFREAVTGALAGPAAADADGGTIIRPAALPEMTAASNGAPSGPPVPAPREPESRVSVTATPGRDGSAYRLAYLAAAVLLIVAAAAAAGVYLQRDDASAASLAPEAATAVDTVLPAETADPPLEPPVPDGFDAALPPAGLPPAPPEPAAQGPRSTPSAAPAVRTAPQGSAGTAAGVAGPAPVPAPQAPTPPAGQAAVPPPIDPEAVERELDQAIVRATSIDDSLNRLAQAQARQGLGLRGDITARRRSMQTSLARAEAAMASGDARAAQRHTEAARKDLDALEAFLGR